MKFILFCEDCNRCEETRIDSNEIPEEFSVGCKTCRKVLHPIPQSTTPKNGGTFSFYTNDSVPGLSVIIGYD